MGKFVLWNKKEVIDIFNKDVLTHISLTDKPAMRQAWNNFTDQLMKDNKITHKQYETWVSPFRFDRKKRRNPKKNFKIPTRNIYWKDIKDEKPEIELRGPIYLYYRGGMIDSIIFWVGQEATEAQKWLDKYAFHRCIIENCGIRVKARNMNCGNHR